ncbi:DUF3097 domain-containing protein [Corynebacterium flavescens]|uniref:DUF3097 domain-containing protein n=1 Tax=Corynebacterium flavescens TaxID=28028 RepID=UPI0026494349|nr:DUF3097 domain-containing protein [Corynebacterium flavescens]MDN6226487.1 DUF3097 domain-containing protein [Corynebacterium flavescens]MDN6236658.1 DUF3097 domain-containing protein [Corynebacterium flavescens]MDN6431538.1 DUF3097 domain-containing protein [Corynebacterium flavescens]MDN6475358.1 DUF3097 domain-containing protein [Corynebacterium flavescens]MDN6530697.1 DUF3097 domain-containing protein [Corynebacterium flavescens]
MNNDPYGGDILRGHSRAQAREYPEMAAEPGMVVEVRGDDFVGAVLGVDKTVYGEVIRLEDRYGTQRVFNLVKGGFLYEGQPVTLTRYRPKSQPQRSNSGSRRVSNVEAKIAAPSRIWVEGIHDAAIVEKVWGHDLRVEGVVVEYLEGLDNLPQRLAEFGPVEGRRVGVLADHLVEGSKETRLTQTVGEHVLVTGHPFIDIWAAVKPERLGLRAWPEVPYGEDWKTGICRRVGWSDPKEGWNRVYNAVHSFRDLDSTLIGAVERLVDFVTTPELRKEDLL